jgi:hypothetical protein
MPVVGSRINGSDWIKRIDISARVFRFNLTLGCHQLFTADLTQGCHRLFGADPTAEVAGSGRGRRRLALTVARHGRVRRLTGVRVFSSYGGRFSIRFSPTGSQWRGECVYANLNWRRAATKPGSSEAARLVLVDGDGGLRWSFGSKDVRQGFLELPSSFSADQLLQLVAENSNLVAT